jgi:hypothetical protein
MREPRHEVTGQFRRLPVKQHAPTSNLLFLPGATKLAARLSSTQLVCYPVPNSPFSGVGKARSIIARSRYPILAIGRFSKQYAVVSITDQPNVLEISWPDEKSSPTVRFRLPDYVRTPAVHDDSPVEPLFRRYDLGSGAWHWFTRVGDLLVRIVESADSTVITDSRIVWTNVSAIAEWSSGLASVTYPAGESKLEVYDSDRIHKLRDLGSTTRAYFGTGGVYDRRSLCAVEMPDSRWRLIRIGAYKDEHEDEIVTPTGGDVVGVYGLRPPGGADMAVALLSQDRMAVNFWQQYAHGEIFRSASPIVQVSVSPYIVNGAECSHIAYLTERGELGIHSINSNSNLMQLELGDTR